MEVSEPGDGPEPTSEVRGRTLARISDGIISLDADLIYRYANERALELLDTTQEELVGQYIWDRFPQADGTVAKRSIKEAIETGQAVSYERYNTDAERWFDVRVYPEGDGVTIYFADVTERKNREAELEQYKRIVESLPVGVAQTDIDGDDGFELVNQGLVDMVGADSKDDLRRQSPTALYADTEDRKLLEHRLRDEGKVEDAEFKLESSDGEQFWASVTATLEEVEGQQYVLKIIEDVTKRRRQEQELETANNTLEAIINAAPVAIVVTDSEGRVTRWNPRAEEMFGWSADEVLGDSVPFVSQDADTAHQVLTEDPTESDQTQYAETVRQTKSGETVDVAISTRTVEIATEKTEHLYLYSDISDQKAYEEKIAGLNASTRQFLELDTKQDVAEEVVAAADNLLGFPLPSVWFPTENGDGLELVANSDEHQRLLDETEATSLKHPRGGWLWDVFQSREVTIRDELSSSDLAADLSLHSTVIVPLGEHGVLSCAVRDETQLTDDDITVARILGRNAEAALQALSREQLLADQRDDLDVLNQIIRHDIRNDLQVILARAEMLDSVVSTAPQDHTQIIRSNAESAVALTDTARDLTDVMLHGKREPTPISLHTTLSDQLDVTRSKYPDADIQTVGELVTAKVLADELLDSVFRNLLTNAVVHNDKEETKIALSADKEPGYAIVSVADNGSGVADEQKDAIFGRGEKGIESQGSGVGLYLVDKLVSEYGGDVWVEDRATADTASATAIEGTDGSVFFVKLRCVEE